MSTRWEREAAKGNEAAVKYKEELSAEAKKTVFSADYETLERKAMVGAVRAPAFSNFFEQMERAQRARRNAEAKEALTYQSVSSEAFLRGMRVLAGMPLSMESKTPRTWGEWADKLEMHDQDALKYSYSAAPDPRVWPEHSEQEEANAARRADWERYLQETARRQTQTKVLGRDPAWGRVVSRDLRAAQPFVELAAKVIETTGVEAASPERAPEAKALFAGLLAQPETITLMACACGLIGSDVCVPVQATLDKRSKFLAVKGRNQKFLSKADHKALNDHRRQQGKRTEDHELDGVPDDMLEVVDTYE